MFTFLKDLVIYPFKPSPDNKFGQFLRFLFRDFSAFFWIQPSIKKCILFPLLSLYHIFRKK